ncbi:MAG: sigma-70 family RNA polymerase sigma factor [Planctomycetes bacterium]|nr:sigma-70 family RNA polymerase sigma factor [Planctomycetota bacterium]
MLQDPQVPPPGSHPDFEALYDELRRLAQRRLAELPPGQTLQPTALVNEAWLRLAGRDSPLPPGRRATMFLVSRAMRDLLVEDARRKGTRKRGASGERVPLEAADRAVDSGTEDALAVSEALEALERESEATAQVVQLRYFGGLTIPEIADALGRSVSTIERQWVYARAWLRRRMAEAGEE